MSQPAKKEQEIGPPLEISIQNFYSFELIKINATTNATINDIKKLIIEGIDDSKYTLLKGIKNGDILTLVENQFISHHIAQLEHDFHQHQQELAKQIKDDYDDIFQMSNPNEPCLPSGIDQFIESGKEIDFDFNNEQYQSLNAHEKIEAAFQEMCKVGNEYIQSNPVPKPETQQNSHIDKKQQDRIEAYFRKWKKQVEFYRMKHKEFYFYFLSHKEEILKTKYTKKHPLNFLFPFFTNIKSAYDRFKNHPEQYEQICQLPIDDQDEKERERIILITQIQLLIEQGKYKISDFSFIDYDKEFDMNEDEFKVGKDKQSEIIPMKEIEISEDQFEHICLDYVQKQNIATNGQKCTPEQYQAYLKACLTFYLNCTLYPRLFIERILDQSYEPLENLRQNCNEEGFNFEQFKNNLPAISSIMRMQYLEFCEMIRDKAIEAKVTITGAIKDLQQDSAQTANEELSDDQLLTLNDEIVGVLECIPNHFLPFIAYNAKRYLPLLSYPNAGLLILIKNLPEDKIQANIKQQNTVQKYYNSGNTPFKARCRKISKSELEQSMINTQDQYYEMRFEEEPDVKLIYMVSKKDTHEGLKLIVEAQVGIVQKERPVYIAQYNGVSEMEVPEYDEFDEDQQDIDVDDQQYGGRQRGTQQYQQENVDKINEILSQMNKTGLYNGNNQRFKIEEIDDDEDDKDEGNQGYTNKRKKTD
ncbi:MAG: hypothetical protein EZS28_003644 [Streblomastix strix]|uniref:Uncharacterized protein n=1 Tax=Streblomastix strix TaxID=222440 RepID=A0A5J4X259_9EUKA|nr:MAG: hypothetical protein EZS28_003644 [Streblomastix strix]